jgi:acyl-coenzyme A synthetase/AMP-(fatty) acid ligase
MVEAALVALDGVDEVVVVGVPSEEWGMEVGCVYTGPADPPDLSSAALPSYAHPKRVRRVLEIPRGSGGKPDREAIRSLF